jgi:hypothetical protein
VESLKKEGDHVDTYYKLSLLVKTKSKNDKAWISFIQDLHRHATIIACILCMKFDYFNNIIIPESLQSNALKKQNIHITKILALLQESS